MNELDILEQLERLKGMTDKKFVLSRNVEHKEFNELVTYALSFAKKFYVKKFEIPSPASESVSQSHRKFIDLLDVLSSRKITGNAAIQAVELFLSQCTEKQQKWYTRVLKKDLRCGISVKTATSAGFNIPVFDVMLATDGHKCKKINEIIAKGVYASPKLDGYRCIAIKSGDEVSLYSRNGTQYDNFPAIVKLLEGFGGDFILDGEIMSDDFQAMQKSAFASKRGTSVGDVKYHVFDIIPVDEWESENFVTPKADRIVLLEDFFKNKNHASLVEVKNFLVDDLDAIHELETDFIDMGYEGAMVVPNIPYYKGRKSNCLMKFKRMETMDVRVIDVYEGTGKNEGKLGGLRVVQDNGEICDVGTGFTDQDREWIWNNPTEVVDRIAEIQYQEMTKDAIMRFPIFLRWRDRRSETGKI